MTTITVPAAKLREMLGAVLPHAGRDDTLPLLATVRFEVRGGELLLIATDRYSLGAARWPIPGAKVAPPADCEAVITASAAEELAETIAGAESVVALVFGGEGIAMDAGPQSQRNYAALPGEYPDWRAILNRALAGEDVPLGDGLGLAQWQMAKLTAGVAPGWLYDEDDGFDCSGECNCTPDKAERAEWLRLRVLTPGDGSGSKWTASAPAAPTVLAARGDWFIAALMPFRVKPDGEPAPAPPWDSWAAIAAPAQKPEAA